MNITPIRIVAVSYLTLLISLTIHEFAHAWMADRLGDDTPRRNGRLTLNPITIIQSEPLGALIFPLASSLLFGGIFGWASTPVNVSRVRRDISMRKAQFLISVVGPLSNLMLVVISALALIGLHAGGLQYPDGPLGSASEPVMMFFYQMVFINVLLGLFNLLPIPPLDGFEVLRSMLSRGQEKIIDFLVEYRMVLFLMVLIFGGRMLGPIITYVTGFVITLARSVA